MTTNGKFITLEGIEGVGKTSNIEYIKNLLESSGNKCLITREPGGTALGESLRDLLLQHSDEKMSDDAELLMMFAARAEHLQKVILPAIAEGTTVICDRFTEATYAYQGGGRDVDIEKISLLESLVQKELRPDLTIILDASVTIGRDRAGKRSTPDRIEEEKDDFFQRVRNFYLDLAGRFPDRICTVDAEQPLADVQKQVKQRLQQYKIIAA